MTDIHPASWVAILLAMGGALFAVFVSRRGR